MKCVSVTGLASFGDQLIAVDSHSEKLAFYDMRKNSNLTFLSNMEPSEFYQGFSSQKKKVGHTSISITEQHLVTNSMDNHI